ncbi:nucleoside-diphosphate kinase [Paractinoplanes ferrugineus]|uniref:Nucleoside-diphosphate kinase n=1 Tax=Paractinoplanes ferrugineus TaxID=113564 RepID=A0A919J8E8_9ACTN|nr:nucleoside-diphosphate kinase [Actinoplanes ferrugineus]GIE15207.1 nucleoside-diphosphate kinase [Actinoplanes ferrugineus]
MTGQPVDWNYWTVILLKPDCLTRNLLSPVLSMVEQHLTVQHVTVVFPTEDQIFAHYADMLPRSAELGRDVAAELRRIYGGRAAAVALGYGPDAAARLRALLGPTDPAAAGADTIRGRYAADSLAQASADGRLIDNLIHSSDTSDVVPADFDTWFGAANRHLLHFPASTAALIPVNGERR